MKLELIRLEESEQGTLGVLKIDDFLFCCTLEPADKNNKPYISRIPRGVYICDRYSSEKYPNTWEVKGVPDRDRILFHPGNTIEDTEGCILVGQYFGKLRGERAVLNSGKTFKNFMEVTHKEETLYLFIHEVML